MLLIINGMPSTSKHIIASHISNTLNGLDAIEVDGYVCNFTGDVVTISKDNELVYRVAMNGHESIDTLLTYAPEVYDKAEEFFEKNRYTHDTYRDFDDPGCSLGVHDNEDPVFEAAYPSFIKMYNTQKDQSKYVVVTGSFTPSFIERVEADIAEPVIVINLIRHPNISYLLDDSYLFEKDDDVVKEMKYMGVTYLNSIINSVLAANHENVITVRYEDILTNGSIELLGKTITFPDIVSDDGKVTNDERDFTVKALESDNIAEVQKIIELLTNMTQLSSKLPNDAYKVLGYDSTETLFDR